MYFVPPVQTAIQLSRHYTETKSDESECMNNNIRSGVSKSYCDGLITDIVRLDKQKLGYHLPSCEQAEQQEDNFSPKSILYPAFNLTSGFGQPSL